MVKKIIIISFFITFLNKILIDCKQVDPEALMRTFLAHQEPRIFLFSFLRSGNTWMRYCIEVLTQTPTMEFMVNIAPHALPIGTNGQHFLNFSKAPIWKAHTLADLNFFGTKMHNSKTERLIFLLRNPKEAIIRNLGKPSLSPLLSPDGRKNFQHYFENLQLYDCWQGDKILIYYEDFMKDPRNTLMNVLQFLQEDSYQLDIFIENIAQHKDRAIKYYADYFFCPNSTRGIDLLYHSRKLSLIARKKLDLWIEKTYPILWKKYLKERFSEENLNNDYKVYNHIS